MKKSVHAFEWNKVTPLSKYLAMVLFVTFIITGTYFGYLYGKFSSNISSPVKNEVINNSNSWQSYKNDKYGISIDFPSDIKIIDEPNLSAGTQNMQKNWHLLLTNQEDYPKLENNLNGKGQYYIQIEISDSSSYQFPFKGNIPVTSKNFISLFGGENSEKGLLGNRPTLKSRGTTYPKHGNINYAVYDGDRIIEINATSDNLDIVSFETLDKIVSSFRFQ